ncbi:MAG: amidase [Haloglomus sp.]
MTRDPTPTSDDVRRYAERTRFSLSAEEADAFAEDFRAQDQMLSQLDAVPERSPPDREYWGPDEDEDPLGAFLTRCDLQPIADGPLSGMTIAVKDNIAVGGIPMTCGSPLLEDYVPAEDATVVTRLLDAGANIVGKANMDEFAFGNDESTMRFRLARNPRNPDHQPGSSSSGPGVAVGDGLVDGALGTDTGGSIRFPAAWSGVVGLKPTRGLVSHNGFVQYAKTLDNVGPMATSVRTVARILEAIAGPDPRDGYTAGASVGDYVDAAERGAEGSPEGLTIGLPEELFGHAPELDDVTRAALDRLEDSGAALRTVSIDEYEFAIPSWLAIGMTEVGAYFRANLTNYWVQDPTEPRRAAALFEALSEAEGEPGDIIRGARLYSEHLNDAYGDEYYARAQRARTLVATSVDEALADVNVLASTTVPMLAPEWGAEIGDVFAAVANTAPFNLTGHPAISVPCGEVDGLPVGLQFVGTRGDDGAVIEAAALWESMRRD